MSEDFSIHYSRIGGALASEKINGLVRGMYEFLDARYIDEKYRHSFPSVEHALSSTSYETFNDAEVQRIVDTFAYHELGSIPVAYAHALHTLRQRFVLGAVIDIWAPKAAWIDAFRQSGIGEIFDAVSFSSDHGMVKPSLKPFELVLGRLNLLNTQSVVIGDSPRRDLAVAKNAGIDCILVGGVKHHDALGAFSNLLDFSEQITA